MTIHVPLSEAGFLLHMPDFYHELGHLLHERLDRDARYGPIGDGVADAIRAADHHYLWPAGGTDRGAMSSPTPEATGWVRSQWKHHWIMESFCDLFALFAAGPAMHTPTCTSCPRRTRTCTASTCSGGMTTPLTRPG